MADLHPSNRRWMVHFRDRDGKVIASHNMSAHIGGRIFDQRIAVLRSQVPDGWTFDTAECDAEHAELVAARKRHDEAFGAWLAGEIGDGPRTVHPGNPSDWRTVGAEGLEPPCPEAVGLQPTATTPSSPRTRSACDQRSELGSNQRGPSDPASA